MYENIETRHNLIDCFLNLARQLSNYLPKEREENHQSSEEVVCIFSYNQTLDQLIILFTSSLFSLLLDSTLILNVEQKKTPFHSSILIVSIRNSSLYYVDIFSSQYQTKKKSIHKESNKYIYCAIYLMLFLFAFKIIFMFVFFPFLIKPKRNNSKRIVGFVFFLIKIQNTNQFHFLFSLCVP